MFLLIGSTAVEPGTENTSMQLADEDEDVSEEDLLAQALALSMGAEVQMMGSGQVSHNTSTQVQRGNTDMSVSSTLPSGVEEGGHSSVFEDNLNSLYEKHAKTPVPNDLPQIDPLSTFGPFSCSDFWARVSSTSPFGFDERDNNSVLNNTVTIRHAVFALLVVISRSVDDVLEEEDKIPASKPQSSKETGDGSVKKATGDSVKVDKYQRVIGTTLTLAPNPVTTLLIEHLMEVLTHELAIHSTRINARSSVAAPQSHQKMSCEDSEMQVSSGGLSESHPGASPSGSYKEPSMMSMVMSTHDIGSVEQGRNVRQQVSRQEVARDMQESEWHFHQYFLTFALSTVLRLFRATMVDVVSNRFNMNAIGLGGSVGDSAASSLLDLPSLMLKPGSNTTAPSSTPTSPMSSGSLLSRLLGHLSVCMGPESSLVSGNTYSAGSSNAKGGALYEAMTLSVREEKRSVDYLSTFSSSILTTYSSEESERESWMPKQKQIALCYSNINFIHELRRTALDAFVSAISAFYNTVYKRYLYLERLLRSVPTLTNSAVGHCFTDSTLLQLLNIEQYDRNFDMFLRHTHELNKQPDVGYYQLYLLQKVALFVLQNDDNTPGMRVIPDFPVIPHHVTVSGNNNGNQTPNSPYAHLSQKVKSDNEQRDETQTLALLPSIQKLLLNRLSAPLLLQGLHKHRVYSPNKSLFWGELTLLRSIQSRLIRAYVTTISNNPNAGHSTFDLIFNMRRCHPNLHVSEDSRVVLHTGPKLWATCTTTVGFDPGSGVYEWLIRVDKCAKGHAFIGRNVIKNKFIFVLKPLLLYRRRDE